MESFLFQALIYLGAAVISVPIAARLGLGSVLGYLAAGILIGPVFGLVGAETQDLQHFAEFGVVMMLFLIGLELEPRVLWNMRHRLVGLGGSQVLITMGLVTAAAIAIGLDWYEATAVGMIFALSSTAIVLQTLNEKQLMQTAGGRSSFSVLLTQDIAVIPMLALMPLLGSGQGPAGDAHGAEVAGETTAAAHAETMTEFVQNLPGWGLTLLTIAAIGAIIVAGVFGTRPVFRYIHRARLRELYTALALLIVISISYVMTLVGLSPALGAFLAGVVLANSEFRHELESDIEPFKGLLLGLFFITVGAGISFPRLFESPFVIIGLALGLMFLKGVVLYGLAHLFSLGRRDRWLFTLGLAQAGEFGFVLTSFALQTGVLNRELSELLLLIIAMSMLLTPLFFILWESINKRLSESHVADHPPDEIDQQSSIIIAGIGRFGQVVNRMLQLGGFETTVLDHDLDTVQLMRKFGFKGFFGDPTRPELLHAAGLDTAKVLVAAMDEPKKVTAIVEYARKARPDLHIIARAYDRNHVYELYRAGADDIVREVFDSSLRAGRYVLENIGLSEFEASELEKAFFRIDRSALRELAELWKPGVPISKNEAYMERARALNADLESALSAKYDEMRSGRSSDDDEDEDEDDTRVA
ncbi:Kef-type potassium/proton antiporter, CPA2 family [Palleronia marisminoris]|uniref:Glutathione-regulated potassium-efflux system protein KefC n=1 Tax=Palleronia marisminoris TaxID=315423 RepID=A0A1Y5RGA4_9RHOB|nr:monovalent cation:proton antiporter-2 (CPA2) family protein [Palleronia marisminoris]SFG17938.1 Kef-type potassium/proton antiporter, CPA2 family [Palleronia marisminoris]SLN16805.1 Glutathione-regulated potassium-efflux system protein KefC [Palleronia marisminoris]